MMAPPVAHTQEARGTGRESNPGARRFARLAEHGVGGLARRVGGRLRSSLVRAWRRLFQHRNHVFVLDGPPAAADLPPGFEVVRIAALAEFPEALREHFVALQGPRALDLLRWEFERGAVLWLGVLEGAIATTSMSRRGAHFVRWFVPLEAADIVIFRNATRPEFRGRRLNPALMYAAMASELRSGGRAYIDCKVYNRASIHSIERTGFRRIATLPPLKIAGQFRFDVERAAQCASTQ